jgi:hypothetical protein
MAGLGAALALVELENSSDQTSVPDGMLGAKVWVVTVLGMSPGATAMALTVRLEATRNAAKYCGDDALGVVPSTV